jgi:hypothetical protein
MAWHYARGTDLEEFFLRGERLWAEWISYNAVREPDGSELVLNRAIETRSRGKYYTRHNPLAEKVILARAFSNTRPEVRDAIDRKRRQLEENWPNVPELQVGNDHAYSPHVLLNLNHYRWYPDEDQRDEAMKLLPYLASKRFNHQRTDSYAPQAYTFIRRPAYYAIFNTGKRLARQQRFGLGLLWTDENGAILQSQTGSHNAAWGTRAAGAEDVYETEIVGADFQVAGSPVSPEAGSRNLEQDELRISYPLKNEGQKTVIFTDDCIVVNIQHNGNFTEQLPMLLPEGNGIGLEDGMARLSGEKCIVDLSFGESVKPEVMETTTIVAKKRIFVLNLHAEDTLTYRIGKPGGVSAAR